MVRRFAWLGLFLAATALADSPPLFLEAEAGPARVPVQTQAVYRLRLYQGVDVAGLKLVGPAAPLADFRPLGPDRVYEAVRDSRRYRVRERSYAVFPFASGELSIAGAYAAGTSPDGRPVRVEAPVRSLAVLPVPPAAQLAARSLVLAETWRPAGQGSVPVGGALRRVVRIEAVGAEAANIPAVPMDIPGMAVHPEPPRLENRFEGEINIGVREQGFRLVPRRPGPVEVPELGLDWWDARAGKLARAALPPRRIEVAGAPAASQPEVPAGKEAGSVPVPALVVPGIVLALGFLAWCLRTRLLTAWSLRVACGRGDARAVRDLLLARAAVRWPGEPPVTLDALALRLPDPEVGGLVRELERRLYGPEAAGAEPAWLARAAARIGRGIMQ